MKAKIRNGNLLISLPLEKPRLSASGKSQLVATSHGVRPTIARLDGKLILVVANAFFYPESGGEVNVQKRQTKQRRTRREADRTRSARKKHR